LRRGGGASDNEIHVAFAWQRLRTGIQPIVFILNILRGIDIIGPRKIFVQRQGPPTEPFVAIGTDIGIRNAVGGVLHGAVERDRSKVVGFQDRGELVDAVGVEPGCVEKKD
jgi:hypothetical protein